jgi:hypothetical protein
MLSLMQLALVLIIVVGGISASITAYYMRRRIKKSLGPNARNANLTSLNTWMAVDEAEKKSGQTKPPNPS